MLTLLKRFKKCALCGIYPALPQGYLCQGCHSDIDWLPNLIRLRVYLNHQTSQKTALVIPVQATSYYAFPLDKAIINYKYQSQRQWLTVLYHCLKQLPLPQTNSVLVPMPTTNNRLRKRGFDHVYVLAKWLSKYWAIPLWQGVKRIGDAHSQQGLNRIERLQNMRNQFVVVKPLPKAHFIVLDDVTTTGASLAALALCMVKAGLEQQQTVPKLSAAVLAKAIQGNT